MRAAGLFALTAGCNAFQFLSIGDWGASGAKETATAMSSAGGAPEWILSVGDNFYSRGVTSVDDTQFKSKWEDTFSSPNLQVPWYLTSGNHDYYGGDKSIAAEIAYSDKSSRWNFPSFYYDKVLTGTDGVSMHLVVLDTWRLNGGDHLVAFDTNTGRAALRNHTDLKLQFEAGDVDEEKYKTLTKNFRPNKPEDPVIGTIDQAQYDWIDATLADSTADWKVVVGHFPVYSCTRFEHGDTPSLVKNLLPLLKKHSVDMYMSGHDHILQHIYKDDIHFFGTGAGAMKHSGVNEGYSGLEAFVKGSYGFMLHEADKSKLTTTFIDSSAVSQYSYAIQK